MAELYHGIAGSPITYITSDITAAQTTISVADDAALPDAPNICTIGFGENIETIRYGAKSNGALSDVTRGIEGTPQAWQAGTEVARFFTAYDHNSIIENFNAHLAESASKHIKESGQNENGKYIKFDDGTMICHSIPETVNVSTTQGTVYGTGLDSYRGGAVKTYPATFVETPSISVWGRITGGNSYASTIYGVRTYNQGAVSCGIQFVSLVNFTMIEFLQYIAIGRWKA